jgi:hypothetical protein
MRTIPKVGARVSYSKRCGGSTVYSGTVLESPSQDPDDSATCLLVRPDCGGLDHHVPADDLLVDGRRAEEGSAA